MCMYALAGNIGGMEAKALPGNDSRYIQVKLHLKSTPDILLDHFGANDKYDASLTAHAVVLLTTMHVNAKSMLVRHNQVRQ